MTARLLAPRRRRRYSRTRRRSPRAGSLATWIGLYGRDSRYRVPDARARYGYRLAPAGERARLRLRCALVFWSAILITGVVLYQSGRQALGVLAPVLGTVILAFYAHHRLRVNHPMASGGVLPAPAGEARERKPIPREVKAAVWKRDGGKCRHCGLSDADATAAFGVHLHYDHIVPFSKNGTDTENNIQLLCEKCNLAKGNRYTG